MPTLDIFADIPSVEVPIKKGKEKKAATPRALDIFDALAAVDKNDGAWLSRQSDQALKEFSAPVFLRWASSMDSSDPDKVSYMIEAVNEHVNKHMWALVDHPELIFMLAASCGLGMKRKALWIKGPDKKAKKSKVHEFISHHYPDANDTEIDLILNKYNKETFHDFVYHETGCSDDEARDIMKAYTKLLAP